MKIICSDGSINSYGFKVLTNGIDLTRFEKNPIMLWNHNRGWSGNEDDVLPIGKWGDLKIEGDALTAVPDFNEKYEFAAKIKQMFEDGYLNGVSIGITILELSEDPAVMDAGQKYPTVTKCILKEISVVDIPSNANAVRLYDADDQHIADIELSLSLKMGDLPALSNTSEMKVLAITLGLAENATESEVNLKLVQMMAENRELKAELAVQKQKEDAAKKVAIDAALNDAVEKKQINVTQRQMWQSLLEKDFESASAALSALSVTPTLKSITDGGLPKGDLVDGKFEGKDYEAWTREKNGGLAKLKANNPEVFKQLYKARFGVDYKD